MKTAIVTGASGFLGRALVRELVQQDYRVWAISRTKSNRMNSFPSQVEMISCDLSEIASLTQKLPGLPYDVFFHLAWSGVSGPERFDAALQLKNVQWTLDALRTAKELGCKRFLGSGSIMEYETEVAAHSPGCRPGMGYVYGSGKAAAHAMCMSLAAQLEIDLVWPIITNVYGPEERSPRLVNSTIQKCIRGESPQFTSGTQNYDFVYIEDAVRALRLIAEKGTPFHEYHIGSGKARPLKEFLLEMQAAIAPTLPFRFGDIPFTGINLPLERYDCSQTEAHTGFQSQISFSEGCRRTSAWWTTQRSAP